MFWKQDWTGLLDWLNHRSVGFLVSFASSDRPRIKPPSNWELDHWTAWTWWFRVAQIVTLLSKSPTRGQPIFFFFWQNDFPLHHVLHQRLYSPMSCTAYKGFYLVIIFQCGTLSYGNNFLTQEREKMHIVQHNARHPVILLINELNRYIPK